MRRLLERSWLVVIAPILTLFLGALAFSLYGTYLAAEAVVEAITDPAQREVMELVPKFFGVIDVYLLTVVLYIFAVGLHELFLGKLAVPHWLEIESLDDLKAKLASVVILFVAIAFVKYLVDWTSPLDTLWFAISTALIIGSLLLYYRAKEQR